VPAHEDATRVSRPAAVGPQARIGIEGQSGGVPIEGPGPWLLGRDPAADVAFADDRTCSRRQASISRAGAGFVLLPLSQSVPTLLDGLPVVETTPLHDGATLAFGMQRLVFTLIGADFAETTLIGGMDRVDAARERIALDRSLTVGRQDLPDQIVLDHPSVSRRHAAFERRQNKILVRDLGAGAGGPDRHRTLPVHLRWRWPGQPTPHRQRRTDRVWRVLRRAGCRPSGRADPARCDVPDQA
jgi:pSer/pThr/pTyr-binding forkhead associated (FHA) protein